MYELWEADQEDWRTCRRDDVIENLLEKVLSFNWIAYFYLFVSLESEML